MEGMGWETARTRPRAARIKKVNECKRKNIQEWGE